MIGRICGAIAALVLMAAGSPALAMDGIPHNGGGGGSGGSGGSLGGGDAYASLPSLLTELGRLPRETILNHLRQAVGDGVGLWGAVVGDQTRLENDAPTVKETSTSGFAGADVGIGGWRVGLLLGTGHSNLSAPGAAGSGDDDITTLGLYAGGKAGPLDLRAGVAGSRDRVTARRGDATTGDYRAGFHGKTEQAFGEVSYPIRTGGFTLEPYGGLSWVRVDLDDFTETGGTAPLMGRFDRASTGFADVGVRLEDIPMSGPVTAHAAMGWRHAFSSDQGQVDVTDGTTAETVLGATVGENEARLSGGLRWALGPAAHASLDYDGLFGSGNQAQALTLELSSRF